MSKKKLIPLFLFFLQTCFGSQAFNQLEPTRFNQQNTTAILDHNVYPSGVYVFYEEWTDADVLNKYLEGLSEVQTTKHNKRPNPLPLLFKKKQAKNKKITAAILSFPFPFGIVGLHRIYLGCAPYVPVAYIASLGGMFGLLPLIDFCAIVFSKDIEQYSNNKKVFMWVN